MNLRKWKTDLKDPFARRLNERGTFYFPITAGELNEYKWARKRWRNERFTFAEEVHWWKRDNMQTKINAREK